MIKLNNYKQMHGPWRKTINELPTRINAMIIEVQEFNQTQKATKKYNALNYMVNDNNGDYLNSNEQQKIIDHLNNQVKEIVTTDNNDNNYDENINNAKKSFFEKKMQKNIELYYDDVINNKFYDSNNNNNDNNNDEEKYRMEFVTEIAINAVDQCGNSMCIRVNDWKSWIYIEFFENRITDTKTYMNNLINRICNDFRYKKYSNTLKQKLKYELVYMSRLCGFIPDPLDNKQPKKFPYYKLLIPSRNVIKIIKEFLGEDGNVHQDSIAATCNFLAQTGLKESCWFTLNKWQEPSSYISHAQIEIVASWKDFEFDDKQTKIAPFTVASFDIEAYSGRNVFCTPNHPEDSIVCINTILYRQGCEIWPETNPLEHDNELYNQFLSQFKLVDKNNKKYYKNSEFFNIEEEEEEIEEEKIINNNKEFSNAVNIMNTKTTRRICHLYDPTLKEKKMEKWLLPTKYKEDNVGILVLAFSNALEMMESWRDYMTIVYQVDLYMGHNITFDWKFIFDHVNFLSQDNIPYKKLNPDENAEFIDWNNLKPKSRIWYFGKNIYTICPLTVLDTKSKGRGARSKCQPHNPTIMTLDTYLLLSEDSSHKYSSYTLNFLSKKILQDSKVDLPPKSINEHFKSRYYRDIIQYCDHDCLLVSALVKTLRLLIINMTLSKVCNTAFSVLTTRGLQIRTWNLLVRECYKKNILFYILTAPSGNTFDGGCVLEPIKGFYDKNVVFTLDFASLYPTIIQDYNLCYSTLFYPQQKPDDSQLVKWYGKPKHLQDDLYFDNIKTQLRPQVSENTIDLTPSKTVGTCHFVQSYRGVLPSILDDLRALRAHVKNKMKNMMKDPEKYDNVNQSWKSPVYEIEYLSLDAEQLAIKLTMNAIYGFTGVQSGKLPCHPISECVTYLARKLINFSKNETEKVFSNDKLKVIYGDTDSIMVLAQNILIVIDLKTNHPNIECMTKSIELGKQVEIYLNNTFLKVGFDKMNLVWEKAYTPYLLGGKKNYAGLLWTQPHKYAYLDIKTLGKKRDIYQYIRETMEKMLNTLFIDRKPELVVKHVHELFKNMIDGKIDIKKFTATKQLRQFNYGNTIVVSNNNNTNNNTLSIQQNKMFLEEYNLLENEEDNNEDEEEEQEIIANNNNTHYNKVKQESIETEYLKLNDAFAQPKRQTSIPLHAAANMRYAKDFPGSEFKPGDRIEFFISYNKSKPQVSDRSIVLEHYKKLKQLIEQQKHSNNQNYLNKRQEFERLKLDVPYYIKTTNNQFWKILEFIPGVEKNIFEHYTNKAIMKLEGIQDLNQFFNKKITMDEYFVQISNDRDSMTICNNNNIAEEKRKQLIQETIITNSNTNIIKNNKKRKVLEKNNNNNNIRKKSTKPLPPHVTASLVKNSNATINNFFSSSYSSINNNNNNNTLFKDDY